MKARFENGVIVLYKELPTSFKNDEVNIVGGFDLLSKEELEHYGFYDVIEPPLKEDEEYDDIRWDESLNSFIYNVIPKRPVYKVILTPLEFLNRFTDEEAISIVALTKTSPQIELWWIKYNKAQDIDLNDPQTLQGVRMLETAGIIASGRADEILTKYSI